MEAGPSLLTWNTSASSLPLAPLEAHLESGSSLICLVSEFAIRPLFHQRLLERVIIQGLF